MATISLYTICWNNYWDKYGAKWTALVNQLNTAPDEIVIVSESQIDTSSLSNPNVKLIVVDDGEYSYKHSFYRNVAVENCTSEWVVPSDIDDMPLPNFLDNLDDSVDVFAFAYKLKSGEIYQGDERCLTNRLSIASRTPSIIKNVIPSSSAVKRKVFELIRYEDNCVEDSVFYSTLSTMDISLGYDVDNPRFVYTGSHGQSHESLRVSRIYGKMLSKNYRPLYVCWFSGANISENRQKALDCLYANSKVDVELVTDDNFYQFNNGEIPIHPAFEHLSDIHKSAYARAYLMYFHGGGYSDVKPNNFDWNPYFDELLHSRHSAIGYPEKNLIDIARFWDGATPDEILEISGSVKKFAGNGHFIFKPKTQFAKEWLIMLHRLLDDKYSTLKEHPGHYHPRAIFGGAQGDSSGKFSYSKYPVTWNELAGRIKQKIEYENGFSDFILSMPFTNIENYR
jgi:hypothetical protein